jgi:cell division septation protein DedD
VPPAEKPVPPPRAATPSSPAPQVKERLPRVPTEAQVRAAQPPPPPAIARAPSPERVPEPEDSPPTAEETAPARPTEAEPPPASPATPAPPPAPASVREQTKEPAREPTRESPPASGFLIQIAAVREEERAEAEWQRLQRQHADLLRGLKLFVIKADLGDKGVFWRLRAGPFADETQAKSRCADLAKQKVGCLVVKAQG